MNHDYIEEHNIRDRYLLRRLTDDERARFEAHFVDCDECLEELEATERFVKGLKTAVAQDFVASYAQMGLLARAARAVIKSRLLQGLLVAAILLLIALPIAIWSRRSPAVPNNELAELRRENDEKQRMIERLQAESLRPRQSPQPPDTKPQPTAQNAGREPVFILSLVRSADTSQPASKVVVPKNAPRVTLSLEMEPDPNYRSYRATLIAADGRNVWARSGLGSGKASSLNISLNSALLVPGSYRVQVEGLTSDGRYVPTGTYLFMVPAR